MHNTRGLAALILTLLFSTSLFAEYLYQDDVVQRETYSETINKIGQELFDKTGVSLYMIMVRELDTNQSIAEYALNIAQSMPQPAVVVAFSEEPKQVQIVASPASMYEEFDRGMILSPNASFIGAVISSLMFAESFDDVQEEMGNYGGVVLPVLAERAKGKDIIEKYAVAMFGGYSETAEQIAATRNVDLESAAGNGNQIGIDIIRYIFYGTILYAIFGYFKGRRRAKIREAKEAAEAKEKENNEQ